MPERRYHFLMPSFYYNIAKIDFSLLEKSDRKNWGNKGYGFLEFGLFTSIDTMFYCVKITKL